MTGRPFVFPVSLLALMACGACQRDPPPPTDDPVDRATVASSAEPVASKPIEVPDAEHDDVRSGVPNQIELPPPDAPTPPMAEGADITYTCEDGSELRVTYAGGMASVALADGRIVPLPRSAQAAEGAGGEVYIGEALALRRLGNVVELQQDQGAARRCRESGGNA